MGFEPTTSAMPMPHPTGLDDRPFSISTILLYDININTFNRRNVMISNQHLATGDRFAAFIMQARNDGIGPGHHIHDDII